MAGVKEHLNIRFFDVNYFYNINLIGYYIQMTDQFIKRHYIFESHSKQIDIIKDSDGSLTSNKVSMPEEDVLREEFFLAKSKSIKLIPIEEYLQSKAGSEIIDEYTKTFGDYPSENIIIPFDKLSIVYDESKYVVPSFFGVNLNRDALWLEKTTKEEFLKNLNLC